MKKKLISCKECGEEILKKTKKCPHCGAKNKKPFYKKWWFWLIVILALGSGGSDDSDPKAESTAVAPTTQVVTTEQHTLPVKFGSVIGIETTGENTEAIVLSMEDPSSSKGAERDVYIASVDYIFTHASKDLAELSVTANNPDGDCIISFTMPSDLIKSLRKTEAEGSWGTEGFCAYFYFNSDAYDELVASCVYSESTSEPTIETAEATTEATTEPVVEEETLSGAEAAELVMTMVKLSVVDKYDYHKVEGDETGITVSLAINGLIDDMTLALVSGHDENYEPWMEVKDSMVGLCNTIHDAAVEFGMQDPVISLLVLNDKNHDNVVLMIMNGVVVYDAMAT